jgi:parallel beta-helix repeat protein
MHHFGKTKMFILAAVFAGLARTDAADFFIAPDGSDANPGSQEKPFATLTKAHDAARTAAGKESVTVFLHDGIYPLPQGLKFDVKDGGTREAPVTWRAWKDEKPVLVGGRTITNFVPHKGEIVKADVGAQGFKGIAFHQLIFDGKRQHLARYPNFNEQNPCGGGWAYADGKLVPMYADIAGETKDLFTCKTNDVRNWARPDEVEVFVFARYNWWNDICRIKSFDVASRKVKLAQNASYPVRPGDRYFFQNALEELDAPGEWYLDRQTSTLYFWPPSPLAGKTVVAPSTRSILQLAPGTANLTLRGLTFECAEGTAITMSGTTNCLIAACTIRSVGDYNGSGVAIGGGQHNGVQGCDIFETGSHGISISGGDVTHLIAAENFADNNYIHHVGVFHKQGVGVNMTGVGNRASHNLIHDGPRMGIMFHGNNLVFEYNEIRHMNLETEDTGAIYTGGRDWLGSRGSVIRYNYFHDMLGFGHDAKGEWQSPHFAWGIYLDDNSGGVDVIGNIVARCPRASIHLHNGRDNLIENNIFVDAGQQQMECSGWTDKHRYWTGHLPTMIKGYESVASQPEWQHMRNMSLHPTNAVLPDGKIMTGNVFTKNIIAWHDPAAKYTSFKTFPYEHNLCDSNLVWHCGLPVLAGQKPDPKQKSATTNDWAAWQSLGMDRNSVIADPLFENASKDDYRVRPRSPAFKLGFVQIPVEKIGPYNDELRASWPIVEAGGAREKPLVTK